MNTTIFVFLVDEGTEVWRPVAAERVHGDVYRITGRPPDDAETWQFTAGDLVRCRESVFQGGESGLVAYERITGNSAGINGDG